MRFSPFVVGSFCLGIWAASVAAQTPQSAPTLRGAREILSLLPAPKTSDSDFPSESRVRTRATPAPPVANWQSAAKKWKATGGAPNAGSWLQIEARRLALPQRDSPTFSQSVGVLPAPQNWRALLQQTRALAQKKPTSSNSALYFFAARLNGEEAQQIAALRALYRHFEPRFRADLVKFPLPKPGQSSDKQSPSLGDYDALASLLILSPAPAQQIVGWRWKLEISPRRGDYEYVSLPDFRRLYGEGVARSLVPLLLKSTARLEWYGAPQTAQLAREMWLADPKLQTLPQWELASSYPIPDARFALATIQKFPQKPKTSAEDDGNDSYQYQSLRATILGALLSRSDFTRATALMSDWRRQGYVSSEFSFPYFNPEAPRAQQLTVLKWIEQTMLLHSTLNWWEEYRQIALRNGQTRRALDFVRAAIGRNGALKSQTALRNVLARLHLDAGEISTGGNLLARQIETGLKTKSSDADRVISLLKLTRVAPNAAWLQTARRGAAQVFATPLNTGNDRQSALRATIALQIAEQNGPVFAQNLLVSALTAASKTQRQYEHENPDVKPYLYALMSIYYRANRPADALFLLQNARGWGARELSPLLDYHGENGWSNDHDDPDTKARPRLGVMAAWALSRQNRASEAIRILRASLERESGHDPAYALLCELQGPKATPFLQQLAARDAFEERPLIWQAFLARRADNALEAQKLARRAIAIDPSDGEQPRGDRLRAYGELGAALRMQNAAKNAAQTRDIESALRAIRLSESADKWRVAGVSSRAIELYSQSLRLFDNAYCVQSRLAVELSAQGDFKRAAHHFERAYQLMPDSFGRLESHCFGCEGVFGGKESESIARRVFLGLETARPNDPKVAYLAGYWRYSSGKNAEAARYFSRAVALDPQYLSAWKKMGELKNELSPLQHDRAILALIRLDPRGKHTSFDGGDDGFGGGDDFDDYDGGVTYEIERDFRGLWRVLRAAAPRRDFQYHAVFPLKNSQGQGESSNSGAEAASPAAAIARQSFVRHVSALRR